MTFGYLSAQQVSSIIFQCGVLKSEVLKSEVGVMDQRARLREKELLSRYRAQFEGNLLSFVRARAHVLALMTQKSCAVGMRNAKLGNYLKEVVMLILKLQGEIHRTI